MLPCPIKIANERRYLESKQMFPSSKAKKPVLIVKTFSLSKVDCNENGGRVGKMANVRLWSQTAAIEGYLSFEHAIFV